MANFPSAIDAVLELVDDGADDWEGDAQRTSIQLDIEINHDQLWVRSRGEIGMGYAELEKFLKWGLSEKRERIGRWGQGGKAAAGYIAQGLEIECSKRGENIGWKLISPTWGTRSTCTYFTPQKFQAPKEEAYVVKRLFKLKKVVHYEGLIKKLSNVYRPLLGQNKLIIWVRKGQKGRRVEPLEIPWKERKTFESLLPNGKRIYGDVGIIEPGRRHVEGLKPGARCHLYGRLVTDEEFFGHPTPAWKASLNSLIAEVHIDFPLPPNLHKTDFDKDSEEWKGIEEAMHRVLQPWVHKLLKEREEEVPEKEKNRAKKALDLIQKAFRELDRILSGKVGQSQGQKHQEYKEKEEEEEKPPRKERSDKGKTREPDTPPPLEAIGTRRRLGGVDVDVQAGDGTVRSTLLEENSNRKVIIYSKYPAYAVSKGAMVYLMETIALELAKLGPDEPKDIGQFLWRVNEALRLAASKLKS